MKPLCPWAWPLLAVTAACSGQIGSSDPRRLGDASVSGDVDSLGDTNDVGDSANPGDAPPSGDTGTNLEDCIAQLAQQGLSCNANASCVGTSGSYGCQCNPGYYGDGATCQLLAISQFICILKKTIGA